MHEITSDEPAGASQKSPKADSRQPTLGSGLPLAKFQSLIALFLLCLALSILSDKFLTFSNLWNVMRQISVNICISVEIVDLLKTFRERFVTAVHPARSFF